jgi:hypothetical protein
MFAVQGRILALTSLTEILVFYCRTTSDSAPYHPTSRRRSAAARGTSLISNTPLLGPYSRTIPRVHGGPKGGGLFLMSEVHQEHREVNFSLEVNFYREVNFSPRSQLRSPLSVTSPETGGPRSRASGHSPPVDCQSQTSIVGVKSRWSGSKVNCQILMC